MNDLLRFSPIRSLFVTIANSLKGKIYYPQDWNGIELVSDDKMRFTIFRHVIIGKREDILESAAVFLVRFKLKNMTVEKNRKFSKLPIPMFIGLPGFKAKFWMCNEERGYNQGIYQWQNEDNAKSYSKSFALRFMTGRSYPDSVSFRIIPKTNIYEFVEKLIQNDRKLG